MQSEVDASTGLVRHRRERGRENGLVSRSTERLAQGGEPVKRGAILEAGTPRSVEPVPYWMWTGHSLLVSIGLRDPAYSALQVSAFTLPSSLTKTKWIPAASRPVHVRSPRSRYRRKSGSTTRDSWPGWLSSSIIAFNSAWLNQ